MERRTVIKGAAWSVPVIAAAVAAPLAAASTPPRRAIACTLLNGTGHPFYDVLYSDQKHETLSRDAVAQDKDLLCMCPEPSKPNEGKTGTGTC